MIIELLMFNNRHRGSTKLKLRGLNRRYDINEKEFIGVYRWLSREFTTVECTRTCE